MSDDPAPIIQTSRKPTLGDRIRGIANQLREKSEVQIKATSRILGAAAQIAQNHDQLIDEVVEMVEEDLDQQAQVQPSEPYTVEKLQQQFKTLKDAKAHFGVKGFASK
jgi:D-aminopeptidase